MAVEEAAQEIGRQEAAFGADGLEFLVGRRVTSHQPRQQDVDAEQVDRQHRLDADATLHPRGGAHPLVSLALGPGSLPRDGFERGPELRQRRQREIELLLQGGGEEIALGPGGQ